MVSTRSSTVKTFLFTDIVGSTQLTDTLGDEGAQEILRLHNALLRAEVVRHGGSEVKAMGDGFMIAFGSVSAALACAVGIARSIERHNEEQPTREFAVRMGLNAGEAIEEERDFFGAAVIVAARIAALAGAGEILISAAVKQLAQGTRGVEYRLKGTYELKGFREAYEVYQVISGPERRPGAALRRPQLVGREQEMAALNGHLEQVLAGRGLFLLLTGDPGIGKTRLAEELARHGTSRGFRVFRGRCFETEGAPPYAPFVEIIQQYIQDRPEDVLLDELGDDAAVMAKLVPELSRRVRLDGDLPPLPPEQERYRILEAVRRWLERIAGRRPIFLLIDDLQWAGPANCLLLQHLAPTLANVPIFIFGTSHKEGTLPSHPLAPALTQMGRFQVYKRMNLEGLPMSALRELLVAVGRGQPPSPLVEALYRHTEGNPFFVAELVNHLDAEGRLFAPSGEWQRDISAEDWDIPETVRLVIQRRLGMLQEETRRVLVVASLMSADFTYDLLETLGEVPSEALLDGLEEAMQRGMIEEIEGAAARFHFAHQLIKQTLYDDLSGLRRQRLHLRIGETLEEMRPMVPAELAYHFSRAGSLAPSEKTFSYLVLAGDESRRTAAWEGAAAYYKQALTLMPDGDARARADLLRQLGEAQSGKGDWEDAVASLKEAMDLFQSLGDTEATGWIGYFLRRLYGARGEFSEARDVVERSLSALGESDSEIRSRLLAQAGFIRSAFGEIEEAERVLDQSMGMAERLDSAAAQGFAAFIRGLHCLSYCRLAEASQWMEMGAGLALAANDLWSASQANSFRRHILFALGDLAQAEEAMDEEERLAHKAGNFLAVCETKWISSGIASLRGDLPRAEALANELISLIEASRAESGLPGALINLAYIHYLQGDWDAFEEPLRQAISVYERMSAAPIDDPRPVLLLLKALTGRTVEAKALLPDLQRYFDFDEQWTTSLGEARITLAAALAVLGDKDAVCALYAPLEEWTSSSGYVLTGASSIPQLVSRALGMAASISGSPERAGDHFARAIDKARELGAVAEQAEACYWYARHLLAGPDGANREKALALLSEGAGLWQRAGMEKHVERAMDLEAGATETSAGG